MSAGPEFSYVEQPFLNQLASMGWKVITGSVDHPSVTGRENFREVLIKDDLGQALRRNNLRDGTSGSTSRASRRRSTRSNGSATRV
jgi:type I restriction enzyme R subunit